MKSAIQTGTVYTLAGVLILLGLTACGKNGSFRSRRFTGEEIREWNAKAQKDDSKDKDTTKIDPADLKKDTIDPTRDSIPFQPVQTQRNNEVGIGQKPPAEGPANPDEEAAKGQMIVEGVEGETEAPKQEGSLKDLLAEARALLESPKPELSNLIKGIDIHLTGDDAALSFSVDAVVIFEGAEHFLYVKDSPVAAYSDDAKISPAKVDLVKGAQGPSVAVGNSILVSGFCTLEVCEEIIVRIDFAVEGGYATGVFQLGLSDGQFKIVSSNLGDKFKTFQDAQAADEGAAPADQAKEGDQAAGNDQPAGDDQKSDNADVGDEAPISDEAKAKAEAAAKAEAVKAANAEGEKKKADLRKELEAAQQKANAMMRESAKDAKVETSSAGPTARYANGKAERIKAANAEGEQKKADLRKELEAAQQKADRLMRESANDAKVEALSSGPTTRYTKAKAQRLKAEAVKAANAEGEKKKADLRKELEAAQQKVNAKMRDSVSGAEVKAAKSSKSTDLTDFEDFQESEAAAAKKKYDEAAKAKAEKDRFSRKTAQ